ncbi:MAG: endo-1,4-beta-xylanase [Opitutaceae bacterium]|nr:endo-1,4-beta-xylanase [Opitutaceae bacterium]
MKFPSRLLPFVFLSLLGCQTQTATPPLATAIPLKEATRGHFLVGAAINAAQITGKDRAGVALIDTHFDTITPENDMKWQHIHPELGRYNFRVPDKFVEFGRSRGMWMVGHTLMWHSQTPDWVFKGEDGKDASREVLLARLTDHIRTVVGRYRGKVKGWDVVNEAIRDEDGLLRTEKPWYRILGEEGIFAAFAAAHEADPDAELYYNEYALENPVKRAGVLKLVQAIRARGLRIDGVGSQGHYGLDWPELSEIDDSIKDFAQAGFKVMYTELDVTVLPRPTNYFGAEISKVFAQAPELDSFRDGLPAEKQAELAKRYADCFAVFAKYPGAVTRVTLWGVTDRTSWLNNWPIRGRTDYPMLFDRQDRAKPAVAAVIEALQAAPQR